MMNFENRLAALNEWHFFSEFTYSKTTFQPAPSQEAELADAVIWLGVLSVVFQIKERERQQTTNSEVERRWFKKKVLGKATQQIRDTLKYFQTSESIEVRNRRGHTVCLAVSATQQLHKLVVHSPSDELPEDCRRLKHHRSQTAGVIHIISADDYLVVVRTLLTPAEFVDYLGFREAVIHKWESDSMLVTERALLGQYLSGQMDSPPSADFIRHLQLLEHRTEEWDMSGIISKFSERIAGEGKETEYYPIIRELALLKRNELREFKTRFQLSIDKARANELVKPYRVTFPRTGCGFVIVPLTKDAVPYRTKALKNFVCAHKYEMKVTRCVGVTIAVDNDKWFSNEWLYVEFPWEVDSQLDAALQNNYPFHKVNHVDLPRYTYSDAK